MMTAITLVVVEGLTSAHMETPMVAAGVAVVAAMVTAPREGILCPYCICCYLVSEHEYNGHSHGSTGW